MRPYRTRGSLHRNYAVNMIGHDYELIHLHFRPNDFGIRPLLMGQLAQVIQGHLSMCDGAEYRFSAVGTYCDGICPRLGEIETWQPDGPPLVDLGVVIHLQVLPVAMGAGIILQPFGTCFQVCLVRSPCSDHTVDWFLSGGTHAARATIMSVGLEFMG